MCTINEEMWGREMVQNYGGIGWRKKEATLRVKAMAKFLCGCAVAYTVGT
jgi:hypothetical protein